MYSFVILHVDYPFFVCRSPQRQAEKNCDDIESHSDTSSDNSSHLQSTEKINNMLLSEEQQLCRELLPVKKNKPSSNVTTADVTNKTHDADEQQDLDEEINGLIEHNGFT